MGRTGRDGPSAASLPPICEEEIVASAEEGGVKAIPLAASDGGGHDDGNGDGTALPGTSDPSPIYLTSDAGASWELTWPIWHLLSHAERKDIATRYGYSSIGEFEEYMTLTRAVGATTLSGDSALASSLGAATTPPYDNAIMYDAEADPRFYGLPTVAERSVDDPVFVGGGAVEGGAVEGGGGDRKVSTAVTDDDDSSVASSYSEGEDGGGPIDVAGGGQGSQTPGVDNEVAEQWQSGKLETGGFFILLPDEVNRRVLGYLDVDTYGVAALVSPYWRAFTRTEVVYKELCERCYLNQSKRKALHVSRFGGSYRTMLVTRPRVRTGSGLYVLKYSQVKKIQRDMWTEIPVGAILESVYYRYMWFHENGQVMYALSHSPPFEMIPRFQRMRVTCEKEKSIEWGRYEVQKHNVTVWASHPWHDVKFELRIIPKAEGVRGRFCALAFERHLSSASGNFDEYWSRDLVDYKVPSSEDGYFRFLTDSRL